MGKVRYRVVQKNGQDVVEEIHKIVVHRFKLSDVEDPDIYAAEPILQWQKSEAGQFVMKHAIEQPMYHQHVDYLHYGYQYAITAELESKKLTEYYLRWGKHGRD